MLRDLVTTDNCAYNPPYKRENLDIASWGGSNWGYKLKAQLEVLIKSHEPRRARKQLIMALWPWIPFKGPCLKGTYRFLLWAPYHGPIGSCLDEALERPRLASRSIRCCSCRGKRARSPGRSGAIWAHCRQSPEIRSTHNLQHPKSS